MSWKTRRGVGGIGEGSTEEEARRESRENETCAVIKEEIQSQTRDKF